MYVINSLAPVFLIIALGAALRRFGWMPPAMAQWASEVTYWVALPALLVVVTAGAEIDFARHADAYMVLLGGSTVCLAVAYVAAWLMKVRGNRTGAFVQASFRGNLAFIGVPVIVYSLGNGNGKAVTLGLLLLAGMVPFFNTVAVLVLLAGQHRFNLRAVGVVLAKLVTNPLILACAFGLTLAGLGWPLPAMVERTLQPLGRMALPLALLSIGASLDLGKVHGDVGPILAASLIKVAVAPLAGWALGRIAGLSGLEMSVILILLACPTAAATYVLADQLGADTQLSAGVIVASTLLSFGSLLVVLWL